MAHPGRSDTTPGRRSSAPSQYTGKRRRTRRRLLAATTAVVADHGLDGATIGAIANEAGVVPGTIYHHFGGRDALIATVMDDLVDAVGEGLHQVRQADDDPAVRIALAGIGLFDRAVVDQDFARAFGRLLGSASQLRVAARRQVADVIAEGMATGRFRIPSGTEALVADALLAIAAAAALGVADGTLGFGARQSVAEVMLATTGVEHPEAEQAAKEACAMIDAVSAGQPTQL